MTEHEESQRTAEKFIQDHIDSVPHLESLLLLWNSRPRTWAVEEVAHGLFVDAAAAKKILQDLSRQKLVAVVQTHAETYAYASEPENDRLMTSVAAAYREDLIRITRMIHSKPPAAVREFAKAFRFTKERE